MKKIIGNVTIVGNNHKIPLLDIVELSDKERAHVIKEYDWIFDDLEDWRDCEYKFFYFRGQWYCDGDFMAVHNEFYNPHPPAWQTEYDGYLSDTFFSGVLIKYWVNEWGETEGDYIQAYTFYS